ncbi:MAG: hypothetical protein IKM08_06905, partial [Clostridia bacterium]|nr:hypothetical protein [Clostridia bacterium]
MKKVFWLWIKYGICLLLLAAMLLPAVACAVEEPEGAPQEENGDNDGTENGDGGNGGDENHGDGGNDDGEVRSPDVIVKTSNYSVTVPMMAYMVACERDTLIEMYNQFGSNLKIGGGSGGDALDIAAPLKDQIYSVTTDSVTGVTVTKTWFDYFADIALDNTKQILAVCEQARANGFALAEQHLTVIDDMVTAVYEHIELYNLTVEQLFGADVIESDIRAMVELVVLASAYVEFVNNAYSEELRADLNRVEEYYNEHKNEYDRYIDFVSFTFEATFDPECDDRSMAISTYEQEQERYDAWIDQLNACADYAAFHELLIDCLWAYENGAELSEVPDEYTVSRELLEEAVKKNYERPHGALETID